MPELPEVETIRNYLRFGREADPSLIGKKIIEVHLLWDRTLAQPEPDEFTRRITGQTIEAIERRGKYLMLSLSGGDTLLIHLRMSGDLLVESTTEPPATHHRLLLDFEDGLRLAFNDTRKFGRVWLTEDPQQVVGGLGPEPLDPGFTPDDLYAMLQSRKRLLKPLLLDQSFLAGLGNIYTDEALHRAKLHPLRISNELTREESDRLYAGIREALREGIRHQGTTIDWVYRGGGYQNYLRAYNREGQPCPVCGTPIEKITVGQRGTHFCPTCQPPGD